MINKYLSSLLLGITIFAVSALAQTEPQKDPNNGLPKSGVLSNSYSGSGAQNSQVPIPWNREGSSPDSAPPVAGSVSRSGDKKWLAKTYNNSEDSFDISIKVKQLSKTGSVLRSDYFSFRLKPNQSDERTVSALVGSVDAQLELASWKRLTSAKKAELKTEPATTKSDDSDLSKADGDESKAEIESASPSSEAKQKIKP